MRRAQHHLELVRPERFFDVVRDGDVALLPALSVVSLALLFEKHGSEKSRDLTAI
jgi:hypothetical protein